ncbi:hypothetical protein ES703_44022 [subsurface metagenome]
MSYPSTSACMSAISGETVFEDYKRVLTGRGLIIHEGYTELRTAKILSEKEISPRGVIKYFSKKSRIRLMKFMASIKDKFLVHQTFTFPDDVMEGKSISERSRFSNKVRRRFLKRVRYRYPSFKAVIRQEWEQRKSGNIIDESCPHLHFLYLVNFLTKANHKDWATLLGKLWVDCLGTKEHKKALSVAVHEKSYVWMKNSLMARRYVSKYIAKVELYEGDESRGRAWYKVGDFDIPEPEWQVLTDREEIAVRRVLRCYMKRQNRGVAKGLKLKGCNTFVFIRKETIHRIIDHVNHLLYDWKLQGTQKISRGGQESCQQNLERPMPA